MILSKKIVLSKLWLLATIFEFELSEAFANSEEVLQECSAPGTQNKFEISRIRRPQINVEITQLPFMASYGYLQGK